MMSHRFMLTGLAGLLIMWGCTRPHTPTDFTPLNLPGGPGSMYPSWAVLDDTLYLSWLDTSRDSLTSLRYATCTDGQWSPARDIASGSDWFVNWADFPAVLPLRSGRLAAHVLVRSGPNPYAYDAQVTVSSPDKSTWSPLFPLHQDTTGTEHGFVSLYEADHDRVGAVWLDGRLYAADGPGPMTLRHALFDASGQVTGDTVLDDRVCDCCQTSVTLSQGRPVVSYRDRTADDIRDISRVVIGETSLPAWTSDDGWKISGCPVNGAALASREHQVAIAWFSGANELPRVSVAFSADGGRTFGNPLLVSGTHPEGRTDIAWGDDGSVWVSWIETTPAQSFVYIRNIRPDGQMGQPVAAGVISAERNSGFPVLACLKGRGYIAWTGADTLQQPQVQGVTWSLY
ncbi:MAG: hypothetical protein SF053_13210 [Bacteroidia bacterium]|nr:hypothetical protein [Bacteroidia bacterium]